MSAPSTHTEPAILQLMRNNLDKAQNMQVKKRDGRTASFDAARIEKAIEMAFRDELKLTREDPIPENVLQGIELVLQSVLVHVLHLSSTGKELTVELIQDTVEEQLMRNGHYNIARSFIIYRADRKKARLLSDEPAEVAEEEPASLSMTRADGSTTDLNPERVRKEISDACSGLEGCDAVTISEEVMTMLYDGVTEKELEKAMIFAVRSRIEKEPNYNYAAGRLLLNVIYRQALDVEPTSVEDLDTIYKMKFAQYIEEGIQVHRLNPALAEYNLDTISAALHVQRDQDFQYLGLQTVYDRYLIHDKERRMETPQYFWMRVAMGLALNEEKKEERAIEFYNTLSQFLFVSSTPTLFNAGTLHPQLSSCYLLTVDDKLEDIFQLIADDAALSKWAGGLGNDWTNIRSTGSHIKGTNGKSQGIIPFLKVANDTAVAVNQGGKRKGAMCAYLETWHLDIEDFLDLRKNTGDERRRTHDMNTANWIPDLFMKRVQQGKDWTLFDPSEAPDLHDLYGTAFEKRYAEYEAQAAKGELDNFKTIPAADLWRKMLSMLFETGHPWITFKDPSNIRSPQDHAGVVHSSNLCTEILLNTSSDETAVCNLGSVNLVRHIENGDRNEPLLESTISTAMRMLDNVIDRNYYPTPQAENSNKRHRPVGLGVMGFQDALYTLNISYASTDAVEFADKSQEMISYYAIKSSIQLAEERGTYETYKGSKWDRGLLPIDTVQLLADERGSEHVDVDTTTRMDWDALRSELQQHGIRNSNTMAIAPTATIANISGVSQSIEPQYKHLFSKSNLSGDFTAVNVYLVNDLKERNLWDDEMLDDLKYFDGCLEEIERMPADLKQKYITAFAIEPKWLIDCASRRQKWIDMGQSLNLYMGKPSGKALSEMYMHAWKRGLKTTYYLRSLSATQVEKSTQDINRRGLQPRWMKNKSASSNIEVQRGDAPKACSIDNPECEACQ